MDTGLGDIRGSEGDAQEAEGAQALVVGFRRHMGFVVGSRILAWVGFVREPARHWGEGGGEGGSGRPCEFDFVGCCGVSEKI